jgi:hypothetical protein
MCCFTSIFLMVHSDLFFSPEESKLELPTGLELPTYE